MYKFERAARIARSHPRFLGQVALDYLLGTVGRGRLMSVRIPGGGQTCILRPRTTDLAIFAEVFYEEAYALDLQKAPEVIIDAGANIGLTTLFFSQLFPEAKILSLEPERRNFRLLQQNISGLPNVLAIRAALGPEAGQVGLYDPGLGSDSFRTVRETSPTGVKDDAPLTVVDVISISQLMEIHHLRKIDVLKLDIEGAEAEVLAHSSDWIDDVNVLCVELHDSVVRGCSRIFYNATASFDLEWRKGSTIFVAREASGLI